MWQNYYVPSTEAEVLALLGEQREKCRIMAGGTDLILELERGVRRQQTIVDITRVPGLDRISTAGGRLRLGPLATHNQVAGEAQIVSGAFPLARACWLVGAPQIRNRGTIAGNLITASPANDTITPLWAMDAQVELVSQRSGVRVLPFEQFFLGVRRTALSDDEMLAGISAPLLNPNERGTFLKLGLRQAQAISLVNAAVIVEFSPPSGGLPDIPGARVPVARARIALGAVAPTILRAREAEAYLSGQPLRDEVIARAGELAAACARPITDIRATEDYRRAMVSVLVTRALRQLRDGAERAGWPPRPVMLWGDTDGRFPAAGESREFARSQTGAIRLTLNGRPVTLAGAHGKTLLNALRDDAGLTGTKEGCAEGECGACTVWLDGIAVMSCLVPVERADGCRVVTVEGLAGDGGALHPVQDAFVQEGAVQCGYCTPGLLMSAANLLAELPHPDADEVNQALTGNLCRCTGYYTIRRAVERAAAG